MDHDLLGKHSTINYRLRFGDVLLQVLVIRISRKNKNRKVWDNASHGSNDIWRSIVDRNTAFLFCMFVKLMVGQQNLHIIVKQPTSVVIGLLEKGSIYTGPSGGQLRCDQPCNCQPLRTAV